MIKLHSTAIDCPSPKTLANFYAELTGGHIEYVDDQWVTVKTDEVQRIAFQKVDDYQRPSWPSQDKPQQLHLDFHVDDIDEASRKAVSLGATQIQDFLREDGSGWRVYIDPDGHPFCLCVQKDD